MLAVCLLFYVGANTLGLLILPGLMVGELMPLRARGIGGGCIFFIFNLLLFFMTKFFPMVIHRILKFKSLLHSTFVCEIKILMRIYLFICV